MSIFEANCAATDGELNTLKDNFYPDEDGVVSAARYGRLEVLKWLSPYVYIFAERIALAAAENGHVNILDWLEFFTGEPDRMSVDAATTNGQLEVVKSTHLLWGLMLQSSKNTGM
jgi:hypothetical protein